VVVSGAEESFHVVPEPVKRPPDAGIGPALDRALGQLWELATGGSPTEGGQTSA
jgi:hypothetical protein